MTLEQFKQPDGWYKFDGCDYEELEDLLHIGVLGFCGCGNPDENLEYIRRGLEIINDRRSSPDYWSDGKKEWDAWWETHKAAVLEHFGNDNSAYFFYYWADRNKLTDHGSSVPGWLSERGERLLIMLNEKRDADKK